MSPSALLARLHAGAQPRREAGTAFSDFLLASPDLINGIHCDVGTGPTFRQPPYRHALAAKPQKLPQTSHSSSFHSCQLGSRQRQLSFVPNLFWVKGTCFGALIVPLGENECPSAKRKGVHQYTLRSRKAKRRAGCKERQKLENSSLPRPDPHHYFITRTSPQNCHLTRPRATLHISDPWRLSLSPPSSLKRETSAQALVSTTHSECDALNLGN